MELEPGILFQTVLGDFINAVRLQSIRRQVDVVDTVVLHEEIDDAGQLFPQCRLASAEPQVREGRCVFRQLYDLFP